MLVYELSGCGFKSSCSHYCFLVSFLKESRKELNKQYNNLSEENIHMHAEAYGGSLIRIKFSCENFFSIFNSTFNRTRFTWWNQILYLKEYDGTVEELMIRCFWKARKRSKFLDIMFPLVKFAWCFICFIFAENKNKSYHFVCCFTLMLLTIFRKTNLENLIQSVFSRSKSVMES